MMRIKLVVDEDPGQAHQTSYGQFKQFRDEADLIYSRGKFYIAQTIQITPEPNKRIVDYLGVDLGMAMVAADSDRSSYSGAMISQKCKKYALCRQHLKMRKTKNSRRRLKKIGGEATSLDVCCKPLPLWVGVWVWVLTHVSCARRSCHTTIPQRRQSETRLEEELVCHVELADA